MNIKAATDYHKFLNLSVRQLNEYNNDYLERLKSISKEYTSEKRIKSISDAYDAVLDGVSLKHIPNCFIDYSVALCAVQLNGREIYNVPLNIWCFNIFLAAYVSDKSVENKIPKTYIGDIKAIVKYADVIHNSPKDVVVECKKLCEIDIVCRQKIYKLVACVGENKYIIYDVIYHMIKDIMPIKKIKGVIF